MLAANRKQLILETLHSDKFVLVSDLSKQLNVTEETTRRDLDKLEQEGLILRVHGGAHLKEGYGDFIPVNLRKMLFLEEKQSIASRCIQLIEEGDIILLDCSTTVLCIAQALRQMAIRLTIITNSLAIAGEIAGKESIRLILLGGEYSSTLNAFMGNTALRELDSYSADKVFLSCSGINAVNGLCDHNQDESNIRQKMIARSASCYFASDSTKIGRNAVYATAPLSCIDGLVLSQPLNAKAKLLKEELDALNVKIHLSDL